MELCVAEEAKLRRKWIDEKEEKKLNTKLKRIQRGVQYLHIKNVCGVTSETGMRREKRKWKAKMDDHWSLKGLIF
jgi:hypothetical protein